MRFAQAALSSAGAASPPPDQSAGLALGATQSEALDRLGTPTQQFEQDNDKEEPWHPHCGTRGPGESEWP